MTNNNYADQLVELLIEKREIVKYEIYEDLLNKIIESKIPRESCLDVLKGLIDATSYRLKTEDSICVKPEFGNLENANNITYLLACSVIQFLSDGYSKIPNSIDTRDFVERITTDVLDLKLTILRDGIINYITFPDSGWFTIVETYKGSKIERHDSLWWRIVENPVLFKEFDHEVLEDYFSELRAEEYKLGWCDNDRDIGVHDTPDITVVEETIKYIRFILDDIPKEKRKIAFNFIINAASCGRGLDRNTAQHIERMKERINNCYSACVEFAFDVNKINEFAEKQNYWNGGQDNENGN